MSGAERAVQLLAAYELHVERCIGDMPSYHEQTLRRVLRHPALLQQIVLHLASKCEQSEMDGEYHNAVFGCNTYGISDKFSIFEVGCTPSVHHFEKYLERLGYDSYRTYVDGILCNDDKGKGLFSRMTGGKFPKEPSEDFIDRFVIGHVLCDLETNRLLMALIWKLSDGRLAMFPPELAGNVLVISREDIESLRCEQLIHRIDTKAEAAGSLKAVQGQITLVVDGYNDECRELFEIEEVKAYFYRLDEIAPHFLFFIASEENGDCVRLFVKMFIRPEFFTAPDPPSSAYEQFDIFILTRLNCVADYCTRNSNHEEQPLDPVTTVHQTFRACGFDIDRSEAQAVLDAR